MLQSKYKVIVSNEMPQNTIKEAFSRIKLKDNTACINMIYALEGAIEGIERLFIQLICICWVAFYL